MKGSASSDPESAQRCQRTPRRVPRHSGGKAFDNSCSNRDTSAQCFSSTRTEATGIGGRRFTITGIRDLPSPSSSRAALIQFRDCAAAWIECSTVRFSSLRTALRSAAERIYTRRPQYANRIVEAEGLGGNSTQFGELAYLIVRTHRNPTKDCSDHSSIAFSFRASFST
jgi:hypothetical protein